MKKLVCVHGHFYQPPRENPWLEEIEREPSASPHHDWNARITEECYAPNAWARIQGPDGRVTRLSDNYARMSFNFGPTLLSWMERHAKATLREIVAADAASVARLNNGNAIAQVYNHAIIPLCNERDKRTQVRWGLADFRHRFGRKARGIWLAETAVDAATLEVLADEGVEFTILSPYQARRFKVDGAHPQDGWVDCGDGSIPTGRAYRYTTKSGKKLALFFYDGTIAKGIAFDRVLADAGHLVGAIHQAWRTRKAPENEPWLVHTATDGESYGHHFRFGDMALASAFEKLERDPDVEIINYATFLDRFGCRGDVEIHPVSAWSYAHGVGRWERDCGCKMNPDPGWTQKWRTPLRHALNVVRDELAGFYERKASALVTDPWMARDAWVDVVLDRSKIAAFLEQHVPRRLSATDQVRLFQLLEMQRSTLLMFTSCGWFFDDVSGGESVILMKYAARALGLADKLGIRQDGVDVEASFLKHLEAADSNVRRPDGTRQNGRDIFLEKVRPAAIDHERVAVSVALGAATGHPPEQRISAFTITAHEEHAVDDAPVPCVAGKVDLVDERTGEVGAVAFVVVGFGGLDWRGVMTSVEQLPRLRQLLAGHPEASGLARVLDDEIERGGRGFTLKDAPADVRDAIAATALARRVDVVDGILAELLLAERALLRGVVGMGGTLAPSLKALTAHALTRRASDVVDELLSSTGSAASYVRRLRTVLDDAAELKVSVDLLVPARAIEQALAVALEDLLDRHDDAVSAVVGVAHVARLLDVMKLLGSDRPLPRVLPLVAQVAERAFADIGFQAATAKLLPALEDTCRSRFAPALILA